MPPAFVGAPPASALNCAIRGHAPHSRRDLGDRTRRSSLTALNVTDNLLFMATNSRMASAVHIMSFVAHAADEATTSEAIAKSLQTTPVAVRKILKPLEREAPAAPRPR